jgi:hypothetical protein
VRDACASACERPDRNFAHTMTAAGCVTWGMPRLSRVRPLPRRRIHCRKIIGFIGSVLTL